MQQGFAGKGNLRRHDDSGSPGGTKFAFILGDRTGRLLRSGTPRPSRHPRDLNLRGALGRGSETSCQIAEFIARFILSV